MTTQQELDRVLDDFFIDGTEELADRVIDAALNQIEDTNQRRPLWVPRRFSPMTLSTRFAFAAIVVVLAVGAALYVIKPIQNPYGAAPTVAPTVAQNPLIGDWTSGPTTCAQQNAALATAGFTTDQLQGDGWDAATCGRMKAGSKFELHLTDTRLVIYQDGVVGWDGKYLVVDSQTFKAGDNRSFYITYRYAIVGGQLTIDMVEDKLPSASGGVLLGEQIAQTVIYETAPFARKP
jgi:hypothetical protein